MKYETNKPMYLGLNKPKAVFGSVEKYAQKKINGIISKTEKTLEIQWKHLCARI